jgi:hypothetical protein
MLQHLLEINMYVSLYMCDVYLVFDGNPHLIARIKIRSVDIFFCYCYIICCGKGWVNRESGT